MNKYLRSTCNVLEIDLIQYIPPPPPHTHTNISGVDTLLQLYLCIGIHAAGKIIILCFHTKLDDRY